MDDVAKPKSLREKALGLVHTTIDVLKVLSGLRAAWKVLSWVLEHVKDHGGLD